MNPTIIIAIVLIIVIWIAMAYNNLVKTRQQVRESWSGIDTELKRRYDLIPNLVETVKGYASHERETIEAVVEARTRAAASKGNPESQAKDEVKLVDSMNRLLAVAEGYPDLKASAHYLELQRELANTEDRIQAARRFYNGNVRDMNTRVEVFPSNIIASMFSFGREAFFEVERSAIRKAVDINFTEPEPSPENPQ
jgi:LemA protein